MKAFRIVLAVLALSFISASATAQVGLSVDFGFPQGKFVKTSSSPEDTGAGIGVGMGLHYEYDLNPMFSIDASAEFCFARTKNEKYRYKYYYKQYHKGGGTLLAGFGLGPSFHFVDTFRDMPFFAALKFHCNYANTMTTTYRIKDDMGNLLFWTEHYKGSFSFGWSATIGLEFERGSVYVGFEDYGKCNVQCVENANDVYPMRPLMISCGYTWWFGN